MNRWLARVCATCAITLLGTSSLANIDPSHVRRLLRVLHGVEQEYREGFDDAGRLVRPIELEEAALLLAEAREVANSIGTDVPNLVTRVAALTRNVEGRAAVVLVATECRTIRDSLVRATGIGDDVVPPAPPSSSSGAELYKENCVSCHGAEGRGDGADAARLARRPPDFSDAQFMEGQSPADFFLVISLGRRGGGMPAWEDALSIQQRWDLVSYLWFIGGDEKDGTARIARALTRVQERVTESVQAYRLQEDTASSLALDAYLSFEPLEGKIAADNPAAVARVENAFVRLQRTLRRPQSLDEVEAAAEAVGRALEAAKRTTDDDSTQRAWEIAALLGICLAGASALLLSRKRDSSVP